MIHCVTSTTREDTRMIATDLTYMQAKMTVTNFITEHNRFLTAMLFAIPIERNKTCSIEMRF